MVTWWNKMQEKKHRTCKINAEQMIWNFNPNVVMITFNIVRLSIPIKNKTCQIEYIIIYSYV